MREQGIRMKFNPLAEVAGKRLVIVDDSIVRGSTTRQIVQMLFDAGAAEVHVRISSPPVVSPCYYGIDLASEDEMIAARQRRSRRCGRRSARPRSPTSRSRASRPRPSGRPSALCRACLTREYPTRVPGQRSRSSASSSPAVGARSGRSAGRVPCWRAPPAARSRRRSRSGRRCCARRAHRPAGCP